MSDAQAIAEACARALYERDPASRDLGMVVESAGPGRAEVTMTVRESMCNGHGTCHGGFVFTLADSAFAFACNSRNVVHVALSCSIDYLAPARAGQRLRAVAEEHHRTRATGLTDVKVYNPDGEVIARFRGRSYQINQPVLEDRS